MGKRNTIRKLPEYKGFAGYYYYSEEDKLWVGHIYKGPNQKSFADMVAWYDENENAENAMKRLFCSMVDDYIGFKADLKQKCSENTESR